MLKQQHPSINKKSKLKLTQSSKFQSQINKQITDKYRIFRPAISHHQRPSNFQSEISAFRQKQNQFDQSDKKTNKVNKNLEELILFRQLTCQTSHQNEKKAQEKNPQKNRFFVKRSLSNQKKKGLSLPKLHLDSKQNYKKDQLMLENKKTSSNSMNEDVLIYKLLQKMKQHILIRKQGEFIYISIKQFLRFSKFLISLVKCQKQDKISLVLQKFPNYSFCKDIILDLFRFYKFGQEIIDTKRSQATSQSLTKKKSKSNIEFKKLKELKIKQPEFDMGKTATSMILDSMANKQKKQTDTASAKLEDSMANQKQTQSDKASIMLEMDNQFNAIQAILQDYVLLKSCEIKETSKKRCSIKSVEERVIHEMNIFHKNVYNDPQLVPDVKQKLMRSIIFRAVQNRYSRDLNLQSQYFANEQKKMLSQTSKQILSPLLRLKELVGDQYFHRQKETQKTFKTRLIQKTKELKLMLQKLEMLVNQVKQKGIINEQLTDKFKEIVDFCQRTSAKCVSFQTPEE